MGICCNFLLKFSVGFLNMWDFGDFQIYCGIKYVGFWGFSDILWDKIPQYPTVDVGGLEISLWAWPPTSHPPQWSNTLF